jgi:plasmid stability protein
MVAIQIRGVPDEVRDALSRRAHAQGQSLQAFLYDVVVREASFANNIAVLDSLASWRSGSTASAQDVLDVLDEARRERPGGTA